ncbi:MAG: hypothetical protein AAF658_07485, partial [Myxococcota bacterium]
PALAQAANEGFASLQSGRENFRYCRYVKPDNFGSPGFLGARLLILMVDRVKAGFGCVDDNDADFGRNLKWRGLGRYFRFKSKSSADAAGVDDYNQPDVWVFLNKRPDDMALDGELDFELRRGGESVAFDARIGEDGLIGTNVLKGVNAISRAQVYYHRPGAWREPPNLFNPYWGARLAPKSVATDRMLGRLGLTGVLGEFFSDNTVMF